MVELMKKDNTVRNAFAALKINEEVVASYRLKTAHAMFHAKFHKHFPFTMTDLQKQEVIERILKTHASTALAAMMPESCIETYKRAVMSCVHDKSPQFHCPVCLDPLVTLTSYGHLDYSGMWFAKLVK